MKKLVLLLFLICFMLCFSNNAFALDIPAIYDQGIIVWTQDNYIYAIGTASVYDKDYQQIATRIAGERIASVFYRSDNELIKTIIALSKTVLYIRQGICYVLVQFPLDILGNTELAKINIPKAWLIKPGFFILQKEPGSGYPEPGSFCST